MSFNPSNIKWGWVVLGVAIAFVIAYGSSICVTTGYATYLAFQAMGAPDQTMINQFAANTAKGVVSTLIGVGTLVGGLLAGRKAKVDALQNGLALHHSPYRPGVRFFERTHSMDGCEFCSLRRRRLGRRTTCQQAGLNASPMAR